MSKVILDCKRTCPNKANDPCDPEDCLKAQARHFWEYLNETCNEHEATQRNGHRHPHRYRCPECLKQINKELGVYE